MVITETLEVTAAPATTFVGRRHELAEARRLLGSARVLTLVGTGGSGKTRLALRLAEELRRQYRDGVSMLMLADLRDPELLPLALAEALHLRDQSDRDPMETIVAHLADRELLLVLDNCEHLIEDCSQLVDRLVRSCPGLHVLATSRQTLRVGGEVSMPVPPMATADAVSLFTERVASPDFQVNDANADVIARICSRLDGLPLAIELAAARARVLSPAQIEQRLDARYRLLTQGVRAAPHRQQTLQAMVDWSHDLCSPEEQLLWARASVFSGGFDLDAAEQVCGDGDLHPAGMLDLIDSLTDKSILLAREQEGQMRYWMLETIREYGAERLRGLGEEDAVRRRHRDWCLDLAGTCCATWEGPHQAELVRRLHREHANLRVALDFCLTSPREARAGFVIATSLDDYWGMRGMHTEVRRWLDQALEVDPSPSPERAAALRMNGWYALLQGDLPRGVALLTEAADVAEETGDRVTAAYVVHAWGMASLFAGELAQAEGLVSDALDEFRRQGVVRGELFSLFILGMAVGLGRDPAGGLGLLDTCIAEAARRGEDFWRAYALWGVAQIEVGSGNLDRAEATCKEALAVQRVLDNRLAIAFCVDTLAWVAERQGRHERAARLFGAADSVWDAIGGSPANFATVGEPHDRHFAATVEALGEQAFRAAFDAGRALPLDQALDVALDAARPVAGPAEPAPRGRTRGVLTRRETEVAALVAAGLTNREIATRLVISQRTAEGHVENILVKLGLRSRAQLAAWHSAEHDSP